MGYKDILVFLDASPDTEGRLSLAASLAQAHGARLLGVDVRLPPTAERHGTGQASSLHAQFEHALNLSGADGHYVVADQGAEGAYAHYADLVVTTQRGDGGTLGRPMAAPEQILLSAGVPVLVLPQGWQPGPVGEHVMLAWNASREATRAAHDALPILARAQKVTVFTFAARSEGAKAGAALMAAHLNRHGVPAKASTWIDTGEGTSPINALFADVDTQDADLIVSGAYHRSAIAERLFGGASHDLLREPTMPLLISH